jgi:hypothetical protein
MAATASTMHPLGTLALDFRLPDTTGSLVSRDDFARWPALLVMFLCARFLAEDGAEAPQRWPFAPHGPPVRDQVLASEDPVESQTALFGWRDRARRILGLTQVMKITLPR